MLKEIVRSLTPPLLWTALHWIRRGAPRHDPMVTFTGNYSSWDAVSKECGLGYADPAIVERVALAARKARDGKVAFESDSLTSNIPKYRYPLFSALGRASLNKSRNLWVLDFGGSLGSSYFQHRKVLKEFEGLKWIVIEQEHFVTLGKREFEDGCLTFLNNFDELPADAPGLILLSSVLGYLREPYATLHQLLDLESHFVFVDRLNLIEGPDRLTLQTVPPEIYAATYPCWFLNKGKFMETCLKRYTLDGEMSALDVHVLDGIAHHSRGYLFKRK